MMKCGSIFVLLVVGLLLPCAAQRPDDLPLTPRERIAKQVIRKFEAQEFGQIKPYLDPYLRVILTPEQLGKYWEEAHSKGGQFRGFMRVETVVLVAQKHVFLTVDYGNRLIRFKFTFDYLDQIASLTHERFEKPKARAVPQEPQDVARLFVKHLSEKQYAKAYNMLEFSARATLPVSEVKRRWEEGIEKHGEFLSVSDLSAERSFGGYVCQFTCMFEKTEAFVLLNLSESWKILQFKTVIASTASDAPTGESLEENAESG